MSICKAVVTGKIVRNPEKRYSNNDFPITSFTMDINDASQQQSTDPKLLKVLSMGKLADVIEGLIQKEDLVLVEGTLQTSSYQNAQGVDTKIIELVANSINKIEGTLISPEIDEKGAQFTSEKKQYNNSPVSKGVDKVEEEFDSVVTADDLIGDDEIPF